ncbi:MAG TPA: TadE/TadG family type IV pilus assembly protein [Terriglobales bacterium]|nr:TadE/TadG family type IV pilus assembly protein [Terriglobales bacterium]
MRRLRDNPRRQQAGSELVELAVLLPCLMLLTLVVSEFAAVVSAHQVLDNAAREGARLAVVPGELSQTGDVKNRVISYAAANGITLSTSDITVNQGLTVNPGSGACSASNPCIGASQVSINYHYPLSYLPQLPFGIPSSMALGAAVEMRNFY